MLCCQTSKLVKMFALSPGRICMVKRCSWQRVQELSCLVSYQKARWSNSNRRMLTFPPSEGIEMYGHPSICHTRMLSLASCLSAAAVSAPRFGWYENVSDSMPVHLMENVLTNVQQTTGLPWWASIICTTVVLRATVTLPLAVYQTYVIAKIENLQPEIAELAKRLRHEVSIRAKQVGWSENMARFHFKKNLKRIISELYVRDNCHPFKASVLIWVQLPLWVFISIALRNLSLAASDSSAVSVAQNLSVGGILWFPDLTLPDSTWIMPISLGLINLLIVEIFALRRTELSKFQKYVTYMIRGFSVLMVPIAVTVPSSMALYWLTSSCVGLGQNLLLRAPNLRTFCRIPKMKSDSDTPFRDLSAAFLAKYFSRK